MILPRASAMPLALVSAALFGLTWHAAYTGQAWAAHGNLVASLMTGLGAAGVFCGAAAVIAGSRQFVIVAASARRRMTAARTSASGLFPTLRDANLDEDGREARGRLAGWLVVFAVAIAVVLAAVAVGHFWVV